MFPVTDYVASLIIAQGLIALMQNDAMVTSPRNINVRSRGREVGNEPDKTFMV